MSKMKKMQIIAMAALVAVSRPGAARRAGADSPESRGPTCSGTI